MNRFMRVWFPGLSTTTTLALALLFPAAATSAPADTLRDLFIALNQCLLNAPAGMPGSEITIVFSLKRDGTLLGKPRISHAQLSGNLEVQRKFLAGALEAFGKCLPLRITVGLGGAIAGRPLSARIVSRPPETDTY
jgi:hypothetical protein